MIRHILGTVISFTLIFAPVTARADDSVPTSELELVTTLTKGDTAPFNGTLFSTAASAKLLAELELSGELCQIKIDKEIALSSARCQLDIDNLNARITNLDTSYTQRLEIKETHINFLDQQLTKAAKPKNELWFALGIVGGVLITGAAAWSMGQLAPYDN